MSTIMFVLLMSGLLLLVLMASTLVIYGAARMVRVAGLSMARALLTAVAFMALGWVVAASVATVQYWFPEHISDNGFWIATSLLGVVLGIWVLSVCLRTGFWRSLVVWMAILLMQTGFSVGLSFVWRPYFFETFQTSSGAMSPTLCTEHSMGTCPECGGPVVVMLHAVEVGNEPLPGLCLQTYRKVLTKEPFGPRQNADRFISNKLLPKQRWDVVTYRSPRDPEVTYVARLVGLPGETVTLADGKVLIDGKPVEPPDELKKVDYGYLGEGARYLTDKPWGSADAPAKLGPDEYFIVGDFAEMSYDSRLWQKRHGGRPAYALPAANLDGVVTHIYWPPGRWRVLR